MNRPIEPSLPSEPAEFDRYLIDDVPGGRFMVHRDVYRDPELFELELRHIFESSWVLFRRRLADSARPEQR